ncbi:MAG: urease accessory protein UreD [Aquabacterium sp.]|nr:urease accessory protein UreD [Aquabacterium sp.]
MGWLGHLQLHYTRDGARTTAHDRHHGPLRVLQRLYPEGEAICHHVLVHPPGGVVGGDVLELQADLDAGSHAVITTPGATRFYRSDGALARQTVQARVAAGARLEWLPMETIAYRQCQAHNQLHFDLSPGAQMLGWDVLALGLPAAGAAFDAGRFRQQITLPGVWQERGLFDGNDPLLLHSPLGLAGHSVSASLWLAEGMGPGTTTLDRNRTEALVDAARALIDASALPTTAGVSAPHPSLLVLRALGHRVEPVMALLQAVRGAWRQLHWGLGAHPPRVWRT